MILLRHEFTSCNDKSRLIVFTVASIVNIETQKIEIWRIGKL